LSGDTQVIENEVELLCVGNAIVDIFARDESGLALRYALCEPVQHVEIEKLKSLLPALCEIATVSGGGAANAAKIAGLLGAKVVFRGAIGSDHFGRFFEEALKSAGVKTRLVEKRSPTGLCLVLQTEGGTVIAASPSAALEFSESDIGEDDFKKTKVVVIDGFMLGRRGLVLRLLELAAQHGTAVAIDLGSPAIAADEAWKIAAYVASRIALNAALGDTPPDTSHNMRRHPFFLFMNEDEAVAFHNSLDRSLDPSFNRGLAVDFEQTLPFFKAFSAGELAERGRPIIVVKLGKRGAVCFADGKSFHAATEAVEPVETTGAGDAFCGAFLAAWARGRDLSECAAIGNRAARIVLGGAGTKVEKNAFKDLALLLEGNRNL